MKRLIFAILLVFLLCPPAQAQGPIYLPVVTKMPVCDRTWRFIQPDGTSNEALNPSFETTGNFAAGGGATVTRTAAEGKYGLYGLRVQTAGNNQGAVITTATLANAAHYVTLRAKGTIPPNWYWSLDGVTFHAPTRIEDIDDDWRLYGFLFPASEASGSTSLTIFQNGAGAGDFFIDGIQVEAKPYWTTFCDGNQPGCDWDGAPNASSSTRSAQSRAGGRLRDFWEDFGFFVQESIGAGASPIEISTRGYALLPGGELTGIKTQSRQFTLIGKFLADSEPELHANRQALIIALAPGSFPESQPVVVRYGGADVQKEISAHYEGGLEAQLRASFGPYQVEDERWRRLQKWEERATIRFNAPDPLWHEVGESAAVLDTNDSATLQQITGRLRSTGQWDDLGLGVPPTTGAGATAIAAGPDGKIYIGGDFTGWDGVAGRDHVAAYDPATDTWETLGGASDFNNDVWALAFGPDGILYAAGQFTAVAGDGDADYLVQWDGVSWSPVGIPDQGAAAIIVAKSLAFDNDGNLYVGGDFVNWANIANADYFVQWDGAAYSAVGSGGTGDVEGIAIDRNNNIYIGGSFQNWAGDADADRLAWWNGTVWAAVNDTSLNNTVFDVIITPDTGIVYIGGSFTDAAGIANADRIVAFNGTAFFALGEGLSGNVRRLHYRSGILYVIGAITGAGDLEFIDRFALWNGAVWANVDINIPGTPTVWGITTARPDPVIAQNFDLYVSFTAEGVGFFSGLITADNEGSFLAYPKIIFERSGGTSATIVQARNETTGKVLRFNYNLLDGETLTIDLSPTAKSIVSSFFGARPSAILANSDFGSFALQQGDNDVSSFVNVAGGPTITAYMLWRTPFDSLD